MTSGIVEYGEGGYDPQAPGGNVVNEEPHAPQPEAVNADSLRTNLEQDIVAMQTIIDTTNATINAGPAPFIKDIARAVRRNAKLTLGDLSTPE